MLSLLKFLKFYLEQTVVFKQTTHKNVMVENIALQNTSTDAYNDEGIFITLINTEEEPTLRNNNEFVYRQSAPDKVFYKEQPIYLNLYVLIASCYNTYTNGILYLERILLAFQKQFSFKAADFPGFIQDADALQFTEFKLELYSVPFEQLNHIWSFSGSKIAPAVLYKIRVVMVDQNTSIEGPMIEEIFLRKDSTDTNEGFKIKTIS
jgi:hypothetical protein